VFLFFSFLFFFVLTAEFASVGKREAGLQRRGQSDLRIVLMARALDGEGKSVVRKKRS